RSGCGSGTRPDRLAATRIAGRTLSVPVLEMLLKRITPGKMLARHEPRRPRFSPEPGISLAGAPPGTRADAGAARRAVRPAPHLHRLRRARRAQYLPPQLASDRAGVARGAVRVVRRGGRSRRVITFGRCRAAKQ